MDSFEKLNHLIRESSMIFPSSSLLGWQSCLCTKKKAQTDSRINQKIKYLAWHFKIL